MGLDTLMYRFQRTLVMCIVCVSFFKLSKARDLVPLPHLLAQPECLAGCRGLINTLALCYEKDNESGYDVMGNWKHKLENMKTNHCLISVSIHLVILLIKYHFAKKSVLILGKCLFSHLCRHNSGGEARMNSDWMIHFASDFFIVYHHFWFS